MPFNSIKRWIFNSALNKEINRKQRVRSGEVSANPARSFLILFNGTDPKHVSFFKSLHAGLEKNGIKPKMLAYVDSKVELHDFGMALYSQTSIKWTTLPDPKLIELVQNREFDVLFHINPEKLTHLHFLAVSANARFKISTLSDLPNDFNLIVKTNTDLELPAIFQHMKDCLDNLAV